MMKDNIYKRLLDNAHDLIWAVDMEGRFIYINDNIKEWGYDKEELIGQPLMDILNAKQIGKRHSEGSKIGIKQSFEMEVLDKLGEPHIVDVSSSPLHDDDGSIIGVMGIIRDISTTQMLENRLKNEERLASLGRLASGVAHEIRNPLSSVKMNLTILMQRLNPTGIDRQHFSIAQEEVGNLEKIVNEILEYAKPVPLELQRTDIADTIKRALISAHPIVEGRHIAVIKTVPEDLPMVMIDRSKLHRALLNLVINAVQASSEAGTIEISVSVTENDADETHINKWLEISVKDHGYGITQEQKKFIFDPFYTSKKSGTGLGLSIVKHIINSHNGTIDVNSTRGGGATFTIKLPAT